MRRLLYCFLVSGALVFAATSLSAQVTARIDLDSVPPGTIVDQVFSNQPGSGPIGVVAGRTSIPGDPNRAMIFDSSNPTGSDIDLGSPNQLCPSNPPVFECPGDCPGVGAAGEPGQPGENCSPLNHLLIVTEDFDGTDPDDADFGDEFIDFDFSNVDPECAPNCAVTMIALSIMDVEPDEEAEPNVEFFDALDNPVAPPLNLGVPGDNGVFRDVNLGLVQNVVRFRLNLFGSGAIDNIVFGTPGFFPYDLALRKTTDATIVSPGDKVTFNIEVFNQGIQNAGETSAVQVIDYINTSMFLPFDVADNPPGLSSGELIPLNMPYSWAASGDNGIVTLGDVLPAGLSVVVPITLTVAPGASGQLDNYSEIFIDDGDDGDSTPDGVNSDNLQDDVIDESPIDDVDGSGVADEDDHDIASVTVQIDEPYDLALNKSCTQEITPGQPVTQTITLINQGVLPANVVQIIDIPDAAQWQPFSLALNPNGSTTGSHTLAYSWSTTPGGAIATLTGELSPGGVVLFPVVLVPNPGFLDYSNFAEIFEDDGIDIDSTPNNGVGGEDDQETAGCPIVVPFDLALRKTTTFGLVDIGDDVTFLLEVCNQGTMPAVDFSVVDTFDTSADWEPFPPALNLPGVTGAPAADCGVPPAAPMTYTWGILRGGGGLSQISVGLTGTLLPGEGVSFPITLTVAATAIGPDLLNYAEIESDNGVDGDSIEESIQANGNGDVLKDDVIDENALGIPGDDEDDHDVASVTLVGLYAVPTLAPVGFMALVLLLGGFGLRTLRRRRNA